MTTKCKITSLFFFIVGVSFSQITTPTPYCSGAFDDGFFSVEDAIKNVTFGTLTNNSNARFPAPHYVFYNNLATPSFSLGDIYTFSAIFEVHGGCGYGVWIDFNHNNIFDNSEKVAGTTQGTMLNISDNTLITQSIMIPSTALTGTTRMRVRIVEDDTYTMGSNGFSVLPCNLSGSDTDVMDWGETEDYLINISNLGSDIFLKNDIVVYPNPSNSILFFDNSIYNFDKVEMYNLIGQKVCTKFVDSNSKAQIIDIVELEKGMYNLKLSNSNHFVITSFVKN